MSIGGVLLTTAFAMRAMAADNQWLLLALLVGAGLAAFAATRSGIASRAEQAFSSHHHLMHGIVLLAFLSFLVVFHEEHFALLMLSTVLLYAIVCLGLNIQIGYCGVVNFAGAAFFSVSAVTLLRYWWPIRSCRIC
ncbi:hypothetical protein ACFS07_07130 [Undibacterium arcticum]